MHDVLIPRVRRAYDGASAAALHSCTLAADGCKRSPAFSGDLIGRTGHIPRYQSGSDTKTLLRRLAHTGEIVTALRIVTCDLE